MESFHFEEAVLAMPYQFLQPILCEAPEGSRPLKRLDPTKRKRYLDLCQVIVKRFASESGGRAIGISVGPLQKHRSWTNITHTILHTTWPTRPDRDWAISLSQGSSNRTV